MTVETVCANPACNKTATSMCPYGDDLCDACLLEAAGGGRRFGAVYYLEQNDQGMWSAAQAGTTPRWKGMKLEALKVAIRWEHR